MLGSLESGLWSPLTPEDAAPPIGVDPDPAEPEPEPERWGIYMKNKYLGGQLQVADSSKIIRDVSLRIQPGMTLYGYFILLLASEMCDKDCPKARSGGAALAAARILKVPPEQMVVWMQRAEQLFAKEVRIVWLPATRPETFVEWLDAARRDHLEYVPADSAQDASLADKMCTDEHFLLGYEQSGSAARPNAPAMELLRWLLLDKPRPQLAFAILRLKPIMIKQGGDFGESDFDAEMPRTWASQWAIRAAKVTSTRFYWVGQGGVEVPSTDAQERERSAAASYARAARQRLGCAHPATSSHEYCRGPMGNFVHMCPACRVEPEAVLRDHCLRLMTTGIATPSCCASRLCSACTGRPDGRKLKVGEERIYNRRRVSALLPCLGGCGRRTDACQVGYGRAMKHGDEEKQRAFCGVWRAAQAQPQGRGKKRARQEVIDEE